MKSNTNKKGGMMRVIKDTLHRLDAAPKRTAIVIKNEKIKKKRKFI